MTDAETGAVTGAKLTAILQRLFEPAPDPCASFPRTFWRDTVFSTPPFRPVLDDSVQVAGAARNASRAWAASSGAVDHNGFVLAVTAKAMELCVADSSARRVLLTTGKTQQRA